MSINKNLDNEVNEKTFPIIMEGDPIDLEELAIAVKNGNLDDSLSYEKLEEAAREIFGDSKKSLSKRDYQEKVVKGNYDGFDLESHGAPNFIPDLILLTRFFSEAVRLASATTTNNSGKAFVMGCGSGRLAIPIIELAKKLGIKEIIFNDLLESHVDETRDKVRHCYNTEETNIDGIELDFVVGDFLKIAEELINETRKRFDAIISMWFVTSEICDFSSSEALREIRKELYSKIQELLTKQGGFIEDSPFSEAGSFHYNSRLKTYAILKKIGILEGVNDQMILSNFSNIQKTGFPFHVRFAPPNGKHKSELGNAKLGEHLTSITTIPSGITNLEGYQRLFSDPDKIRELFESNEIDDLLKYLYKQQGLLLTMPGTSNLLAHKKKTVLWRPNSKS